MKGWFWLLAAAGLAAARTASPFPQVGSDLPPDPAAHYGALANGLRYVIVADPDARGRVSLRLLVNSGSREEAEDQCGLAHFVEHLAFDGSAHYAPGTLIEYLQRSGMSFGPDANATTSFDRTLYLLELPDNAPATIAEGFRVFADYAGGLLLDPVMIEKERGVIANERRARDSLRSRVRQARRAFCLAGDLIPLRRPIGQPEIVARASRARLKDYYDAWYRPDRIVVVLAGNVDPTVAASQIEALFSPLRPRAPLPPEPDAGAFLPSPGLHIGYYSEPEDPGPQISITSIVPSAPGPDSAQRRLARLAQEVALAMVNERLAVLARQDASPFGSGQMSVREREGLYRQVQLELGGKRQEWKAGLAAAEQELRRALEFGFRPEELRSAVANFRRKQREAARNASHRTSKQIADEVVLTLRQKEVFLSPAETAALLGPALERLTPQACADALRALWSPPHRLVMVAGGAEIPGDAAAAIAAAYQAAHAVALSPLPDLPEKTWTYTDFGPPGSVVRKTELADLGTTLITFANGVRLNIKPTPFEAGRIEVNVRFGTGEIGEPDGKTGLGYFSSQTFMAGGLHRYTVDELRRLFAGRAVEAEFTVADDAFSLHGTTSPEDLTLELQLLAAEFIAPGYRKDTEETARTLIASQYHTLIHTLDGPLAAIVPRLLADGDVRIGLPPEQPVLSRTLAEVEAWLTPQLKNSAIEVTIVGDCDSTAVTEAVGRTFGAFGPRKPKPALARLRQVSFPAEPFARSYAIPTGIPTAVVAVYWPTTDSRQLHVADGLQLLSRVLGDRLRVKVREQLGDTYTPSAGSMASEAYPGYGYLHAQITTDPAKVDAIAAVMKTLADDLSVHGITLDELARAKEPALGRARENAMTNTYWVQALSHIQERPETLERPRHQIQDLASVSKPDVDELARTYLGKDKAYSVIVRPALPAR